MADVQHGGCYHCGSSEHPVLISTMAPSAKGASSVALCPPCRKDHTTRGKYLKQPMRREA